MLTVTVTVMFVSISRQLQHRKSRIGGAWWWSVMNKYVGVRSFVTHGTSKFQTDVVSLCPYIGTLHKILINRSHVCKHMFSPCIVNRIHWTYIFHWTDNDTMPMNATRNRNTRIIMYRYVKIILWKWRALLCCYVVQTSLLTLDSNTHRSHLIHYLQEHKRWSSHQRSKPM